MKYLITGGAGFIGCNLTAHLLEKGEEVCVFDNFSRNGSFDNVVWLKERYPNLRVVAGDIRADHHLLSREIELCDVVFHLAGQVAVTTSFTNPRLDFMINVVGTFNILEALRLSRKKPILVYASTNKVYGGMEDVVVEERGSRYCYSDFPWGIPETRRLNFHSPYGCSKGAAEQYVRDYARMYGLKTVVFRQSCIYGTRQFGVEDQGWLAWLTIAACLGKPITVYGDGKQVRDVLWVDDLCLAFEKAVANIDVSKGRIYNIGGGPDKTLSLLELFDYLGSFLGKPIVYAKADWRPGDQKVYISDIKKAQQDLSWQPRIAAQEGVKRLFDWVNNNKELFKI